MRLLVDCHCFDSKMSQGITSYIRGIYTILPHITKEIDFYFVAQDIENIERIFGKSQNIKYIRLSSKNRIYRLLFEIPDIIKKNKIDIAHFQYVSPIIKNCKSIVTLHDVLFLDYPQFFPFSYKFSKSIPFRISAKRADLLCTVSKYSQQRISKLYGIDESEILITPNAVDPEFYKIEDTKPDYFPNKYILYVSRIEPRKNHRAIVEVFNEMKLNERGYKLVFIGKETVATPELHQYVNTIDRNVRDNIIFIEQCSFNELKLWYKYANLFLYPSLAEGFGIPPIEAGASKTPVICHNDTAMSDFTFFDHNLIDMNDKSLLKETINRNLKTQNNQELDYISNKIKDNYNWVHIARDFKETLKNKFGCIG